MQYKDGALRYIFRISAVNSFLDVIPQHFCNRTLIYSSMASCLLPSSSEVIPNHDWDDVFMSVTLYIVLSRGGTESSVRKSQVSSPESSLESNPKKETEKFKVLFNNGEIC